MPAEINAISQLTLLPDAHCRASARLWAPRGGCIGPVVPSTCVGGPGPAALPRALVVLSGEELCFWQRCVWLRGPAGQKIVLFSQQLCYSLSFALNHWSLLPSLELPGFDLESLDLIP